MTLSTDAAAIVRCTAAADNSGASHSGVRPGEALAAGGAPTGCRGKAVAQHARRRPSGRDAAQPLRGSEALSFSPEVRAQVSAPTPRCCASRRGAHMLALRAACQGPTITMPPAIALGGSASPLQHEAHRAHCGTLQPQSNVGCCSHALLFKGRPLVQGRTSY